MRLTASRVRRCSKGFSLLEVIVALAILGIGLTALMQLYSGSLRTVKKAEDHTIATIHARSLLDEALASGSPDLAAASLDLGNGMRAVRTVSVAFQTEQAIEYEVRVKVEIGRGEAVELSGLRTVFINSTGNGNAK